MATTITSKKSLNRIWFQVLTILYLQKMSKTSKSYIFLLCKMLYAFTDLS